MGFELTEFDNILALGAEIDIVKSPDPVSKFPITDSSMLPIQFPPHIVDDTKTSDWREDAMATYEPLATFQGSTARRVTIELIYIVTGAHVGPGEEFTTARIASITKQVKAYFYRDLAVADEIPIIKMKLYHHVGADDDAPGHFRLYDATVTHGDTIIRDNVGTFPLLTKIKITAALTTQVGGAAVDGKQKIKNLIAKPPTDWY